MAKITRFNGDVKAIASESQAGERYVFGSTTLASDDLTAQMSNAILRGWATVGPSDFPPLEWFNAVAFTATQFNAYLHQTGVAEWDALQEYNTDSITNRNGVLYVSQSDLNTGNDPSSDLINWNNPLKSFVYVVSESLTENGYRVWSDGYTEQWGVFDTGVLGNADIGTELFPVSFSTACISVIVGSNAGSIGGAAATEGFTVESYITTGFNWTSHWDSRNDTMGSIRWTARGY